MSHWAVGPEGPEVESALRAPGPTACLPGDTPAGPTPAHGRRRTELHTKTRRGEADPPPRGQQTPHKQPAPDRGSEHTKAGQAARAEAARAGQEGIGSCP